MGEGKWLCLPGSSTVRGYNRRWLSRSQGLRHRSSGLPNNKRWGRNNKYKAHITNKCHTLKMKCYRCSNVVLCNMLGVGIHPGMNYQLRLITGQGVRRGGIMPEVSRTSDKRRGCVSGLADLFWTTFMFEINSSGYFNRYRTIIGQTVRRGAVWCSAH